MHVSAWIEWLATIASLRARGNSGAALTVTRAVPGA